AVQARGRVLPRLPLDVGSNVGVHVRFLFEPNLYPQANVARTIFRGQFGEDTIRDNSDFCVFSFEPNPTQWPRHRKMKEAYGAMGWRYHPIHGGVGDDDGNLTFYHIGDKYGFTMLKSSCRKICDPEYVPVYRLSSWIDREIHGRMIPREPHSLLYERGPHVVMKMDIEMMEWLVFPDLLDTGVFCHDIDGVMGEFHLRAAWFYYPITFKHSRQGDNYTVESWENATKLKDGYMQRISDDPNCTVDILMNDDESHRTDGMPWPKPSNNTSILSLAFGNSPS
ncbi:hypothetical protein ACHAWF_015456, partial [Thalassiosira exigua]